MKVFISEIYTDCNEDRLAQLEKVLPSEALDIEDFRKHVSVSDKSSTPARVLIITREVREYQKYLNAKHAPAQ